MPAIALGVTHPEHWTVCDVFTRPSLEFLHPNLSSHRTCSLLMLIRDLTHIISLFIVLLDEAMNLLVGKIMALSSQSVEGLPDDYIDLSPEPETLGQLTPVASHTYQHTGRKITGVVPQKTHPQTSQKTNCC